MGLHILYSDQIENLANDLVERLKTARCRMDAFRRLSVTVPNPNLAKWLELKVFAASPILCAGIEFPFMEQCLARLLAANLSQEEDFQLLADHAYSNAIAGMLIEKEGCEGFGALRPFRAYVNGNDGEGVVDVGTRAAARKVWGLAVKLADLMDTYEVRRPEIVSAWMEGKSARNGGRLEDGSIEAGEAAVARQLWGEGGAFPTSGNRLSLRQLFDRVKEMEPTGEKEEIYFFGHSTLSILQVKILVWLAKKHEVYFYHNNVCLEYWGDIETKAERIKRLGKALAGKEDLEIENKLLSEWGIAGRETLRLLVELEEENDGRIEFEWKEVAAKVPRRVRTVLEKVQEGICRRTSEVGKVGQDASLQIVGVPSIRREVEMVYNSILGSVWKEEGSGERPWSDCTFSDIAVLVPNMAEYRGVIEAVFDARGQVPYGLIDTTASEDSLYLAGFLALMNLAREGLTRRTLFAVLENMCVQAALGFTGEDVEEWRSLTEEMGTFDGFEKKEGDASNFSWAWGLKRMRLGRIADELEDADGGALPLVESCDECALKFSEVVEFLQREVEALVGERTVIGAQRLVCAEWTKRLMRMMADCLAVGDDALLEDRVRQQILLTLLGMDTIDGAQSFEFVVAAVEMLIDSFGCRRGGYLTHGVTIAGLMPMRPVPFKQVYILGMNAASFPGRTQESTLDLRSSAWHLGDVSIPNVKRYLFLETLMAVRERLVISYVNRDLAADAQMYASGMVHELKEFVSAAVLSEPFREVEGFPLLERGEWSRGEEGARSVADIEWNVRDAFAGIVPTYSVVARQMMLERIETWKAKDKEDGEDGVAKVLRSRRDQGCIELAAKDLADFVKSPMRAALRARFGIQLEEYMDRNLEEDSPLGIAQGPQMWRLQEAWLEGKDVREEMHILQLGGAMPGGFLGDFAKTKFVEALKEKVSELRAFIASFGLRGASEGEKVNWVCEMEECDKSVAGGEVLIFDNLGAEVNCVEESHQVSILRTGYLGEVSHIPAYPPAQTLRPFMSFLLRVAASEDEAEWSLRVGIVDLEHGTRGAWDWHVTRQDARHYLKRLASRMCHYLDERSGGAYVDFEYKRLGEAVTTKGVGFDWTRVAEFLAKDPYQKKAQKDYNNDLVIEEALGKYRRKPTAVEVRELYEVVYEMPLSGEKEVGA